MNLVHSLRCVASAKQSSVLNGNANNTFSTCYIQSDGRERVSEWARENKNKYLLHIFDSKVNHSHCLLAKWSRFFAFALECHTHSHSHVFVSIAIKLVIYALLPNCRHSTTLGTQAKVCSTSTFSGCSVELSHSRWMRLIQNIIQNENVIQLAFYEQRLRRPFFRF